MDIKDIGSMSLDDLSNVLKEAEQIKNSMFSVLSDADKKKVNEIVKGVDKKSLKDLEAKIKELNTEKDA